MPKERVMVRELQKGKERSYLLTVSFQLVLAFGWSAGDHLEWEDPRSRRDRPATRLAGRGDGQGRGSGRMRDLGGGPGDVMGRCDAIKRTKEDAALVSPDASRRPRGRMTMPNSGGRLESSQLRVLRLREAQYALVG